MALGALRRPCSIAAAASGSRGAFSTWESRSKRSSTNWRSCGVMARLRRAFARGQHVGELCGAGNVPAELNLRMRQDAPRLVGSEACGLSGLRADLRAHFQVK